MTDKCWCEKCDLEEHTFRSRMSTCPSCGRKRCPRAKDHRNDCAGTAVKESLTPQPAWHDAPTVPGLWLNSSSDSIRRIDQHDIDHLMKTPPRAWRWYGPLPVDTGDKP